MQSVIRRKGMPEVRLSFRLSSRIPAPNIRPSRSDLFHLPCVDSIPDSRPGFPSIGGCLPELPDSTAFDLRELELVVGHAAVGRIDGLGGVEYSTVSCLARKLNK